MNKTPLCETRPSDGFRYFAAETGNIPVMYTCHLGTKGHRVVVVARNYEKDFPLEELDKAVEFYRIACQENGYDIP